ncbi:Protein of unknown function [Opitutus sp. GAS368]|jgi:hypothetical protein|nr:Protein of unknown function [Opitutus sp. GAS368]
MPLSAAISEIRGEFRFPMKKTHHDGPVAPSSNSRSFIHETIAARAYEMWDHSGRPDHQADAFWLAAECEQVTGKQRRPKSEN